MNELKLLPAAVLLHLAGYSGKMLSGAFFVSVKHFELEYFLKYFNKPFNEEQLSVKHVLTLKELDSSSVTHTRMILSVLVPIAP